MNVMSENDILDHEKLVLFLIMFYIRPWTDASLITLAPRNDLKQFKTLTKFQYPAMKTMKEAMLGKMMLHFWYFSEELSFFLSVLPISGPINKAQVCTDTYKF